MSRSKHNRSGKQGADFWSRRPHDFGACWGKYGAKDVKIHTHRIERRRSADEIRSELGLGKNKERNNG